MSGFMTTTSKPLPIPPTSPPAPPPTVNVDNNNNYNATTTSTTATTTTSTMNKPNNSTNSISSPSANRALAASTDYSYNIALSNEDSSIYRSSNSAWKGASDAVVPNNPLMNYEYREISFDEVKLDEVAIGRYC